MLSGITGGGLVLWILRTLDSEQKMILHLNFKHTATNDSADNYTGDKRLTVNMHLKNSMNSIIN